MKRWFGLFGLFLALILVFNVTHAQSSVFRIGVLDSPRGQITNGARLAVEQINALGGVTGADGTLFRLELVIQPVEEIALTDAVANLLQAQVIAVLGPSQMTAEDIATLQTLGVPVITASLDDTLLRADTSGFLFRMRAPEVWQGRALANYLVTDLNVERVATVQLDVDLATTASVVGFSTAAQQLGVTVDPSLIAEGEESYGELITAILEANVPVTAAFGQPEAAAAFYTNLRGVGYEGIFAFNQAHESAFRDNVEFDQLVGVLTTSTWSYAYFDPQSDIFLNDFVRLFGEVPNAVAAASFDAVQVMSQAISQPGELGANLKNFGEILGVQGVLRPTGVNQAEFSENVAVEQFGGFGATEAVARFNGAERLELTDQPSVEPQGPTATPTLEGVYVTVTRTVQNVRSGPSTSYDIIGQLNQGDSARVIGSTADNSWVAIEFRGQVGWLSRSILDLVGDLNTLPIFTPPPTPTPLPATPTATPAPNPDIVILPLAPITLTRGVAFNLTVTVRNQGSIDAGPFAIATTLQPDGVYAALNLPGLAAGQQTLATLTGTIPAVGPTGTFGSSPAVPIVADLNNQVNEGAAGEANNSLTLFTYMIDMPITGSGTTILSPGGTLTLDGGTPDIQWDVSGTNLVTQGTATEGILAIGFSAVHFDAVNPGILTSTSLPATSIPPGTTIGVITIEGRRAVLRVDAITSGGSITLTYRVY